MVDDGANCSLLSRPMYSMKRVLGLLVAAAVSAGSLLVAAPGASAAYPGLSVTPPVASVSATVGASSDPLYFHVTNTGAAPVMMDLFATGDSWEEIFTDCGMGTVLLPTESCLVGLILFPEVVGTTTVAVTNSGIAIATITVTGVLGPVPPPAPTGPLPPPGGDGYWMLGSDGAVYAFGSARVLGDPRTAIFQRFGAGWKVIEGTGAVKLEPTPSGNGYWIVDSQGTVYPYGDAKAIGSLGPGALAPGELVSSISATPNGDGYWVFTNRGRVVPFGAAVSYGDMSKVALTGPVLGSIPTPSGKGYWMVASDGGIFAFGDAGFFGSTGAMKLNAPVQSLVPTSTGNGYWLVASDGGIFAFGDAEFRGSMGATKMNQPVVDMVRYGNGYLMVGADGGIFNFSDRAFVGSLGGTTISAPITSVAAY